MNGEPISRAELENALNRMPPFPPDVTEAQKQAAYADVLGLMIDEKLLKQFLKKNVPAPDPALIGAYDRLFPAFASARRGLVPAWDALAAARRELRRSAP